MQELIGDLIEAVREGRKGKGKRVYLVNDELEIGTGLKPE